MKKRLRVVEGAILLGTLLFVYGCDSCDEFWNGPKHYYVYCAKDSKSPSGYSPQIGEFNQDNAPGNSQEVPFPMPFSFDCGPSTNGVAPLPNPKSMMPTIPTMPMSFPFTP